jgi:hypothetical protein
MDDEVKSKDIVRETGVNLAMKNLSLPGTTIVRTKEAARRAVEVIK